MITMFKKGKRVNLPSPVSFLDKIAKIEKAKGQRIVRFDLAEPQFMPPKAAIRATISALKAGQYKYSSSWGLPELRNMIIAYLRDTRGLEYVADEVIITTGVKSANYAFFSSLFKKGDGIVLIKPFWTSFRAVPDLLELNVIEVWSDEPYHLNGDRLIEAMAKKPKALVINTPNNPTGGMLNKVDIKLLRDLVVDYDLKLLSDEIDWAYSYDGRKHVSPAFLDELKESTVITDGFSKVFAMTGWRVGFAAGPKELISEIHRRQEHSIGAPPTFAQYGCIAALKSRHEYIPRIRRLCDSNRHEVVKQLNRIEGLNCPLPEGGLYVYPRIKSSKNLSSISFTENLLSQVGVSVIPGNFFGDDRATFRLCYAMKKDDIVEGLDRIQNFFNNGSVCTTKK
jgi:aspartate/methionine/tyrosine aminotransferase